jgi:poly(3-hydroxybutyrate) depolymerase
VPIQFESGVADREYALFFPRQWLARLATLPSGQRKLPLVVALHGGGSTIQSAIQTQRWHEVSIDGAFAGGSTVPADNVFFVMYVQGLPWLTLPAGGFNAGGIALTTRSQDPDDVAVLEQCLDQAIARLRSAYTRLTGAVEPVVDEQRVYLAGFSNGGSMVYRALADSNRWRAGAIFSGQIGGKLVGQGPGPVFKNPGSKTPIYVIHGTADNAIPMGDPALLQSEVDDLNMSLQNRANYANTMTGAQADYVARRDLTLVTALDAWGRANGIPIWPLPAASVPGPNVERREWGGAPPLIRLDVVTPGGHVFPSGPPLTVQGAALAWDFFKLHA